MNSFPFTQSFKAENWCYDEVQVKHISNTKFKVIENPYCKHVFRIVDTKIQPLFEDEKFVTVKVKDIENDNTFTVTRIINSDDTRYFSTCGDVERYGDSVQEVVAKLVAMCY